MGAAAAGAIGTFGAAKGVFSAITEVIDEAGDLLEAIVNNLKDVVIYETTITTTKEYPKTKRRAKKVLEVRERHIKITAFDIVLAYAIGRVLGWWPPFVDWKNYIPDLKNAGLFGLMGLLGDIKLTGENKYTAGHNVEGEPWILWYLKDRWSASDQVLAQKMVEEQEEAAAAWTTHHTLGERSREEKDGKTTVKLGWGD